MKNLQQKMDQGPEDKPMKPVSQKIFVVKRYALRVEEEARN
jgi:hypothetical protein